MKAVQIDNHGGPEALIYRDLPNPTPVSGEAVVDIQAVGVNFTDTYSRAGVNPVASLPWTAGPGPPLVVPRARHEEGKRSVELALLIRHEGANHLLRPVLDVTDTELLLHLLLAAMEGGSRCHGVSKIVPPPRAWPRTSPGCAMVPVGDLHNTHAPGADRDGSVAG